MILAPMASRVTPLAGSPVEAQFEPVVAARVVAVDGRGAVEVVDDHVQIAVGVAVEIGYAARVAGGIGAALVVSSCSMPSRFTKKTGTSFSATGRMALRRIALGSVRYGFTLE